MKRERVAFWLCFFSANCNLNGGYCSLTDNHLAAKTIKPNIDEQFVLPDVCFIIK